MITLQFFMIILPISMITLPSDLIILPGGRGRGREATLTFLRIECREGAV